MIRRQSSKQFELENNDQDQEVIFNIESDDNSNDELMTIENVIPERRLSKLPHQLQVPFQGLKYADRNVVVGCRFETFFFNFLRIIV